jgi:hypothetical protein
LRRPRFGSRKNPNNKEGGVEVKEEGIGKEVLVERLG